MRSQVKSILLCALAMLALPRAELRGQALPVQGTFVYTAEGSDDIGKAIQQATAKMNFVTRPIARSRLKKTNAPYQTINISQSGGQVTMQFDQRKPVVTPANGSAVKWTREDGEVFDVSTRVQDGGIEQSFVAEDGKRVNVFTLGPDGNTLVMHVTITSPRLPQPMTYQLRYRRQG